MRETVARQHVSDRMDDRFVAVKIRESHSLDRSRQLASRNHPAERATRTAFAA